MVYANIQEALKKAKERILRKIAGERLGYITRFKILNEVLGGEIEFGQTITIGARTGVGKSAFGNIFVNDIFELNPDIEKVLLYWNFEMTNDKQALRLISLKTGYSVKDLRTGIVPMDIIDAAIEELSKYNIILNDESQTREYIARINREYKDKYPTHQIINLIDHTRLIKKKDEKREEEAIFNLYDTLNDIKKELWSLNIVLSQLNRNVESSQRMTYYPMPMVSDIFGSDSASQFSEVVLLAFRPEIYNVDTFNHGGIQFPTKDRIFIHVGKNREGEICLVELEHKLEINQIFDPNNKELYEY